MGNVTISHLNQLLKEEVSNHGDRLQVVSIKHLIDLRKSMERFAVSPGLNGLQHWIVNDYYDWILPETDFEIASIIILAVAHPFSADIEMNYRGKKYRTRAVAQSELQETRKYLFKMMSDYNYHLYECSNLPQKVLAVQSGLAEYGKNNITNIEGMGSSFSYLTFYSDLPCEEDIWMETRVAAPCSLCEKCIECCPTGAISREKFLIDNMKCLSYWNESGGKFPDWISSNMHHSIYDCFRCQESCPMNAGIIHNSIGVISFTEEETRKLLQGCNKEDFTRDFLDKVRGIALFQWADGLARNVRAIMDAANE